MVGCMHARCSRRCSPLPPALPRRVPTGTPLGDPPLIELISSDPVLKDTKLIAEAWDCDGLNQVCHRAALRELLPTGS